MSTTQTIDPADVICGLKAAVTALECYHDLELRKEVLKDQRERTGICSATPYRPEKRPVNVVQPIPFREAKCHKDTSSKPLCEKKQPPTKDDKCSPQKGKKCEELHKSVWYPEMRGGVLYNRCYCVHRDGLQDDCPLTQCQGQPDCLAKPWPVCQPGCFIRCQYPELYPPQPESGDHS